MSFEAWTIFALFWVVFVTTPGPNAVNCISNGMSLSFPKAMLGVLAILTQASAFLILSALGVTALIAASPTGFFIAKLIGAGFLIWLGMSRLDERDQTCCRLRNGPRVMSICTRWPLPRSTPKASPGIWPLFRNSCSRTCRSGSRWR